MFEYFIMKVFILVVAQFIFGSFLILGLFSWFTPYKHLLKLMGALGLVMVFIGWAIAWPLGVPDLGLRAVSWLTGWFSAASLIWMPRALFLAFAALFALFSYRILKKDN